MRVHPRSLGPTAVSRCQPCPEAQPYQGVCVTAVLLAVLGAALLLCALGAAPAQADGFVVVRPTPQLPHPEQLAVQYHDVEIEARDQVARVRIDQVFRNLNDREVEGEYIFPIPDGAAVSDFVLYVDGAPVHAEAMDAQAALRIYQDLVRESRDPALLEYAGREMFRARIHPFAPHGERRVVLEYDQLITREGGLYRFIYPLSTEKFSSRPLERAVVTMDLQTDRPIRNAYCPSHDVEIDHRGARRLQMSWEELGSKPDRDLVFYYSLAEGPMDIRVLPYRPDRDEDGYVMLLASLGQDEELRVAPKDIVFVVDRSGSMAGRKIEQAREAIAYCIEHLNARDRFNVITFSSGYDLFADDLQEVSRESRHDARRFVERVEAAGSTNISEALEAALRSSFGDERLGFIVFVTDGLPTAGIEDPEQILNLVADCNGSGTGRPDVRLFTFGVGYDVNAVLLDLLAERNAGRPTYVRPGEDLETRLAGFYDQIADPVLTDLDLRVEGARIHDLQPGVVPDIYRGGQLVLFGRYRASGAVEITLTGTSEGYRRTFHARAELPAYRDEDAFVGRLWATRKVGQLLRNVRLHGERRELVDEIRELGLRFGIVTPYTSFLVDEDALFVGDAVEGSSGRLVLLDGKAGSAQAAEHPRKKNTWRSLFSAQRPGRGGRIRGHTDTDAFADAAPASPQIVLRAQTGEVGVSVSHEVEAMVSADADREEDRDLGVRHVAGSTYHRRDGVWRDVRYPDGDPTEPVAIGSDAYFDLLAAHPRLGPVLALGERVIFQVEGRWYETRPTS